MAHVNRVVELITDDRCKHTRVVLESCPTDRVAGQLVRFQLPSVQAVVPRNETVVVVSCPDPASGLGTDDEDTVVVPVPSHLYVGYDTHGSPSSGGIYRATFTQPSTFGSMTEVVKFAADQIPVHMIVDQDAEVIIVYVNELTSSASFLRKYDLDGNLLQIMQTFTGNPIPAGLAMFRSRQEFVVTQVPTVTPQVLVYDYDYVLQRTLDVSASTLKDVGPTDNWPDNDEASWVNNKLVPGPDEVRFRRKNIDGTGSVDEFATLSITDVSGERVYCRADVRSDQRYMFMSYAEGASINIYRLQYAAPTTLNQIASATSGHGLALNFAEKKVAYGSGSTVRWIGYLGAGDAEIVPSLSGSPDVECLCWGY